MLASAVGADADLAGITDILLLTGEDHFNAMAAATFAAFTDSPLYRVAPGADAVIDRILSDTLFAPALTRPALTARFTAGARITVQPSDGPIPSGTELLFLINPEGTLFPATASRLPEPQPGDTLVLLGPGGDQLPP